MVALKILPLSKGVEEEARELILSGFLERFGFIDHSLNPDLNDLMGTYNKKGNVFLVAFIDGELVATGAITKEEDHVGRIERMSVKETCRRKGIGGKMLVELEASARSLGYAKLVLETNNEWESAIHLYLANHFQWLSDDGQRCHFEKWLFSR